MIQLVPMDETEFQTFLNTAIQSYANDHIKTGKYPPEDALQRATAEFQDL